MCLRAYVLESLGADALNMFGIIDFVGFIGSIENKVPLCKGGGVAGGFFPAEHFISKRVKQGK